ncbi:hypothetical protein KCV07_g9957, partial [Aureobasidium melanogenum]
MSAPNSPLPSPGPAARIKRPAPPRNAVMHREHPPLYAGDFNNNLSKDMYWWEKLDVNDPEEKRVLLAMYYGEERRPRCTVCEKQNRACMWFLGEEEQTHKSCVKCRRVHATCKPSRSRNMETDVDDSRPSIEVRAETDHQRTSSQKRKASEPDTNDTGNPSVKRTRSSWRAYPAREATDDQPEVIFVRSQDNGYAGKLESTPQNRFETPLRNGSSWVGSRPILDDETQVDTLAEQSTTAAERRDGRLSSITLGADLRYPQETHGQESHVRVPRRQPQDNTMPGFSQIEKGLYTIIDERCKVELDSLRTMIKKQAIDHQAQMVALRADNTKRGQNGEAVDQTQIEKLETQIETERSNRRWLEDEITRLKVRRASSATDTVKESSQIQDKDGEISNHQPPVIHHRSVTTHGRNGAAIEQLDDRPPAKRHKISSLKPRFIVQEDSDDEVPIRTILGQRKAKARHGTNTMQPRSMSARSRDTLEEAGPHSKNRRQTVIEIPDSPSPSPLFCSTTESPELDQARYTEVEFRLDDFSTVTGAADYTEIQERLRALETENHSEKRQNRERVRKLEEQISTLREQQDHKLDEKIRELRKNMNYGFDQLMMQQPKEKKKS